MLCCLCPWIECEHHKNSGLISLLSLNPLLSDIYLEHNRQLVNICWMNELAKQEVLWMVMKCHLKLWDFGSFGWNDYSAWTHVLISLEGLGDCAKEEEGFVLSLDVPYQLETSHKLVVSPLQIWNVCPSLTQVIIIKPDSKIGSLYLYYNFHFWENTYAPTSSGLAQC